MVEHTTENRGVPGSSPGLAIGRSPAKAIEHGLSNARVEAINTQIRMITRRAYGFHSPGALIALAMLSLAGLCPPLPR